MPVQSPSSFRRRLFPRVLKLACFLDPEDDRGAGGMPLRRFEATLGGEQALRMVASCAADARDLADTSSRALAVHAEEGGGGRRHYLVFACNRRLAAATDLISHLEKGGADTATIIYTADTVEGLPASAARAVELGATSSRTLLAFDAAQSEHPFAGRLSDMHDLSTSLRVSHVRLAHQGPPSRFLVLGFIECLGASLGRRPRHRGAGEADATCSPRRRR